MLWGQTEELCVPHWGIETSPLGAGPPSYHRHVSDTCYRSVTCTRAELQQMSEEGRPERRLGELPMQVVKTWMDNGKGRPTEGNDWSWVWHMSLGRGTWLKHCCHRAVWRKTLTVWSWTKQWAVHWHSDMWPKEQTGSVGKEEVSLQHIGFKESEILSPLDEDSVNSKAQLGFPWKQGSLFPARYLGH